MGVMSTMEMTLKDVYQLLLGDLRYGYSRNNHLMPGCAYDKVKYLIPRMEEVDAEYALRTIEQICEECITDEICWRFGDGYDDELGNRAEAIAFVRWCMDWIQARKPGWKPYCWNQFEANVALDDAPRYKVYEIVDGEKKALTDSVVSIKAAEDIVFAKENLTEDGRATYHHIVERGEIGSPDYLPYHKAPHRYEFIEPTQRVYVVENVDDGKAA